MITKLFRGLVFSLILLSLSFSEPKALINSFIFSDGGTQSGLEILRPTGEALSASYLNETGSSTNLYLSIDEEISDDDTTFIYLAERYIYYRASFPATSLTTETITSVTLKARVKCAVGGTTTIGLTARDTANSTSFYYVQETVGDTYTEVSEVFTVNPQTSSAWTPTTLNAFIFGTYQTTLSRTYAATQIWLEVAYE